MAFDTSLYIYYNETTVKRSDFIRSRKRLSSLDCLFLSGMPMYLLYADESGSVIDADHKFFVLAGFCIFERQGYWLANELEKIAAIFNPVDPSAVELHGNPMRSRKKFWRNFKIEDRDKAIEDALRLFTRTDERNRLFASVINKASVSPLDPVECAFEQLASRFDQYLRRLYLSGDTQRGIIIFDEQKYYEPKLQSLTTDFRTIGHQWGILRNLSEVPLFLDSKASRLIQLADLMSYAIYRNFESEDDRYYSIIKDRFDAEGGIVHGLYLRD